MHECAFKLVRESLNAKVCDGNQDFSEKVNCLPVEIGWEVRLTFKLNQWHQLFMHVSVCGLGLFVQQP